MDGRHHDPDSTTHVKHSRLFIVKLLEINLEIGLPSTNMADTQLFTCLSCTIAFLAPEDQRSLFLAFFL